MRGSTAQGMMPESPEAWERYNSVNSSLNGASEESIGIYAKNRCQWSGRLIDSKLEPQNMAI